MEAALAPRRGRSLIIGLSLGPEVVLGMLPLRVGRSALAEDVLDMLPLRSGLSTFSEFVLDMLPLRKGLSLVFSEGVFDKLHLRQGLPLCSELFPVMLHLPMLHLRERSRPILARSSRSAMGPLPLLAGP